VPAQALLSIWTVKDGFRDRTGVSFSVDKRSRIAVTILNAGGTVVRSIKADGRRGARVVKWDGRSGAGRIVAPGSYTVHITAIDLRGNRREGELLNALRVVKDTRKPRLDRWTQG